MPYSAHDRQARRGDRRSDRKVRPGTGDRPSWRLLERGNRMQQKERIGKASKLTGQGQTSKGPAEVLAPVPGAAPDIIRPRCLSPQCNARRERGEKRPNGEPIGDPLELMRLRYDFTDGVVAET